MKSQLKIYRGDNNTGLITGAIDSVDSIANGKVGFSLNKDALRAAGVGNGETLYIDYDNITTGLKSNDSTPVGDFNQEFTVQLSPEFDLANMMADGSSTLNLTFHDDSGLDVSVRQCSDQTVKRRKAAILNEFEVFIPARPANYYGAGSTATSEQVITGAIDGIQSMSTDS